MWLNYKKLEKTPRITVLWKVFYSFIKIQVNAIKLQNETTKTNFKCYKYKKSSEVF